MLHEVPDLSELAESDDNESIVWRVFTLRYTVTMNYAQYITF